MTDSNNTPPEDENIEGIAASPPDVEDEDSTGDLWLDQLLSEGILKGMARPELAQACLAAFMIVAIGWIVYSSTATSPFLLGDQDTIVNNSAMHQLATTSLDWNDQIRPISAMSFALNWSFGDGTPYFFQVSQILIHLLNALLVFLLCRRLVPDARSQAVPLIAGLLFAVHPLAAYAVNTLTERDILLATFFMLSSLVLFLKAAESDQVNWFRVIGSLVCFSLAWACGAWTWVLPLLMLTFVIAVHGWASLKRLALPITLFIPVTILLLLPETLLHDVAVEGRLTTEMLFRDATHLTDSFRAIVLPGAEPWTYLPNTDSTDMPLILTALFVIGFATLLRFPRVAVLFLWPALITMATGTGLRSESFNNVHSYPVLIGAVFVIPILLNALTQVTLRTATGIATASAITFCCGITHARNMDWKDEVYFWSRANEECSKCFEPLLRLAQAYETEGDHFATPPAEGSSDQRDRAPRSWEAAERFYRHADEIEPGLGAHRQAFALVQYNLGKRDEAIATMKEAVGENPTNLDAIRSLASWHSERYPVSRDAADLRNAVTYLQRLDATQSLTDADRLVWATSAYQLGVYTVAAARIQQIQDSEIRSQSVALQRRLNPQLNEIGSHTKAFNDAIARKASLPEILRLRTTQYISEGNFAMARYFGEEVVRLTRNADAQDWYALARSNFLLGEWDTFVAHWNPPAQFAEPWVNLAKQSAAQEQWALALQALLEHPYPVASENLRSEALLALGGIALELDNREQAVRIYQQTAQENPTRPEPWLALADIAIEANQTAALRDMLREAESRGALPEEIQSRRDKAGIEASPVDLLKPSTIQ